MVFLLSGAVMEGFIDMVFLLSGDVMEGYFKGVLACRC